MRLRDVGLGLVALLILSTCMSRQVGAQDVPICSAQPKRQTFTERVLQHFREFVQYGPTEDKAQNVTPLVKAEGRISFWSYRHDSLHKRGIIEQILRNSNTNCCGGTDSGECRVSEIDMPHHLALIDGKWCPLSGNTRVVTVEGLDDDEDVVVCAGPTKRSSPISPVDCPQTYCIGGRGGT